MSGGEGVGISIENLERYGIIIKLIIIKIIKLQKLSLLGYYFRQITDINKE